jgi:hypothetical protein
VLAFLVALVVAGYALVAADRLRTTVTQLG